MSMSLEGKTAIVTGAGGGINLAFAKKLLEAGTNVLIADLALTAEAEVIIDKYSKGLKAVFQKTDVTSWPDLDQMFRVAQDKFGPVDIVCPGAGVFEPSWSDFWYPPGTQQSKDDPAGGHYKSLDINLTHPIRTAQLAISHFLKGNPRSGSSNPKRIVFIASIAGEISFLPIPLYHASKWAIMGFARSLAALDEHFGIKVGGVAPGLVYTRLWSEDKNKMEIVTDKETGELQPSWVTPEEVADAMLAIVKDTEVNDGKGEKIPIPSGTFLEVAGGSLRDVPMLGNAGPDFTARGMMLANMEGAYKRIITDLHQPNWGQYAGEQVGPSIGA